MKKSRIVLSTFGSLGDVHPSIAMAHGLKARGHEPVIATSEIYRKKIEGEGIAFHPVRPDAPDPARKNDLLKRVMDQRKGGEVVLREVILPVVKESYEDLAAAARGADLLVSHMLTFATPLVAEKLGLPWASTMLTPFGFFSVYDPPVLAPAPFLQSLRFLGPRFHRPLVRLMKWSVRTWSEPWHRLRGELGLPLARHDPFFEGQHSPQLVLGLFSRLLGESQPDWPAQTVLTGFPFYDRHGTKGMPAELSEFLDRGSPPIVFTLGSSAVCDAGTFYETSVAAAMQLNQRAVLLVGEDTGNRPAQLPEGVVAFEYAPFSELFPRAKVIVHQGGVGTTGQAMRAGRPMLVVPFAHDQPDNAARVVRLGIARTLSRYRYTVPRGVAELRKLLHNPTYAQRAAAVGEAVRQENAVETICDCLEKLLVCGSAQR